FLALYLLAGFGGSCAMVVFSRDLSLGAGASGAIWGLLGSLIAWVFLNRRALPPAMVSSLTRQLIIVVVLNVFITYSIPGISASAHFGGGVVGFLASIPMDYLRFGRGLHRVFALAGVLAVPLVCLGMVVGSFVSFGEKTPFQHGEPENVAEIFREYHE